MLFMRLSINLFCYQKGFSNTGAICVVVIQLGSSGEGCVWYVNPLASLLSERMAITAVWARNIEIEEKVFLHFAIASPLICLWLLMFNCACDTETCVAFSTDCNQTAFAACAFQVKLSMHDVSIYFAISKVRLTRAWRQLPSPLEGMLLHYSVNNQNQHRGGLLLVLSKWMGTSKSKKK